MLKFDQQVSDPPVQWYTILLETIDDDDDYNDDNFMICGFSLSFLLCFNWFYEGGGGLIWQNVSCDNREILILFVDITVPYDNNNNVAMLLSIVFVLYFW